MPSKATGTGSARSWLGTWPGRGSADDPVVDSLLSITRKAWAQNLRLLVAYGDLAADLEADGVEVVALKGAALAVFPNATASFTVPVNPDGTISLEVANATSVVMSLTGYWKTPTATDTGLGLHPLDAPERLVDTTTGTGTCDDSACGRLTALSDTTIVAAGHAGIPADASAIMVAVNVIDPAGPGLVGIGAETGQSSGAFVFDTGDNTSASFIRPCRDRHVERQLVGRAWNAGTGTRTIRLSTSTR